MLSYLRLVLDPASELELERLARLVLPEALVAELAMLPGASFRGKLRQRAQSRTGTDARNCWRLLFQVENLESLARACRTLPQLIDGILSHGVGAYSSPLDEVADRLPDPAAMPGTRALADRLLDAAGRSRRVLLTPHGGLEIPFRFLICKVLPGLRVEYLRPANQPSSEDLVLAFSNSSGPPTDPQRCSLPAEGPSAATELFAALQVLETRHFRKVFTEYVAFDTETTDKDTDGCEVVELAAARVRDGIIVDQFRTLVGCSRPISSGAAAVHGYMDADLVGQPPLEAVWPSFRAFIGDAVLVAHNGHGFDVPVLKRLSAPWNGLEG
ncbi:MAG: PolC-type DNA polymerase III [Gemmataceae bacterium]